MRIFPKPGTCIFAEGWWACVQVLKLRAVRLGQHLMTKSKIQRSIIFLNHATDYVNKTCREETDMEPWASADHPGSLAHWILTQCRIDLQHELRQWGRIHKSSRMPHKRTRIRSVASISSRATIRSNAISPSTDFNRIKNSCTESERVAVA